MRSWKSVVVAHVLVLGLLACVQKREPQRRGEEKAEAEQPRARSLAAIDWKAVDRRLGKPGTLQPDGAYKVGLPRTDLRVTLGGVVLKPTLALGSWVAFKQASDSEALLLGDLVLLEREVAPVVRKLQGTGIEQTALHNHLLQESPQIIYLHISGLGAPARLAAAVHTALAASRTPFGSPATATTSRFGLDTTRIAQVLGFHGRVNGGVYQVSAPRAETITVEGFDAPPSMGLATAINFQPTAGGKTATTGDFVLLGSEVNPVVRALREHGIAVTAMHSHMLTDSPHLFFVHFWATGNAITLARGLRAALDRTNVSRS